ncbi:hypothetical protein NE865_15462 [Phthorimaea operculella]|nr:hypothetical protein NE865_15462 [Phthorimaea operculella]
MWHILDNSNATVISHYTGSGYKCCFCPTEFLTPAQLKQHNIETHPKDIKKYKKFVEKAKFFANLDITDLRCKICKVDIPNVEQLIDHLTNEHKKKVAPTVKNVIFPYKFISDELRCCDCSKLFRTFKTLQEHMHSHYSNYICHVCSAGFVNKRSFDVHMVKHSAKPKFETDHAQPERKTDLMPEKNKLRNICRFCNERFADHRNKLKHMLDVHNVGVSSYKCQLCERVFGSIRGVTDHTKNFHLNMRPHKCELCEMTFYKIYQLKNHMLKHTQIKAHVCEICHKKYARKCTLIEHMRIHTDDRRHVCRVCGLAFIQTSKLKSHMRSSHGEDSI